MTSLPNFSPVTAMSHVEIDQTFEKSMQQLNSSKEYYIFPENAVLINREGKTMRWVDSEDIFLYLNGTTLQDSDNNIYTIPAAPSPMILSEILTFTTPHYYSQDSVFINVDTGERYNSCLAGDVFIDIASTKGTLIIPPIITTSGHFQIRSLNCRLDITYLSTELYQIMRVDPSFVEPSTGGIIMNHDQLDYYTSQGLITEVENVKWFENVLKVTVY